ncbi:hypothetical protein WOLCODRAFT_18145 [Wolfiporia cocos MD-104 SS10]|uniref:DUF659 domain-containing protein n=1 Tax=Wolfiporia cocos (strain MD-104) TaxID=742152 RepID=A0A2H3JYX7_WOLCO|nr:hypothetical protein WOLCODRAFT_18145 [Wolfiporia cocos MD-104 SS10]
MDLNDASHVIKDVGVSNISAVVLDNTGNTHKAHELLCQDHEHILNLQDACHEMNLAVGQISELPEFKEVIADIRAIIAFLNKSTYVREHLYDARKVHKITHGLTSIGETHFSSLTWAAFSLHQCLPALRTIIGNPDLAIRIDALLDLSKFIAVTIPYARAIKCLESTHTPTDVYLFWLAVISQLDSLFANDGSRLLVQTTEAIHTITNCRFNGIINNAPTDIYVVAFFLDPCQGLGI